MILTCGPNTDIRTINFDLSILPNFTSTFVKKLYFRTNNLKEGNRIGVLISGGIDSALLYYLILKENYDTGNNFIITPYSMMRKEGSRIFAIKVTEYIHSLFNIPTEKLNIVGDNSLEENKQVESAISDVMKENDFVYLGIIEAQPQHLVNWETPRFKETINRRYPFLTLNKSHIIDLTIKLNLAHLFSITHSCAINEEIPCNNCNGCNERTWGFEQLGLNPA